MPSLWSLVLLGSAYVAETPVPAAPPAPPAAIAAPARSPMRTSSEPLAADQAGTPANVESGADHLKISGSAQNANVDCKGRTAEITGDYLVVELAGACSQLKVFGNANVVRVDTVAGIEVRGDDNAITWFAFPGDEKRLKKPHLLNVGLRNQVVPGER